MYTYMCMCMYIYIYISIYVYLLMWLYCCHMCCYICWYICCYISPLFIGSGFGKTVVLAWLLGLEAYGIEVLQERWEVSCKAVGRLQDIFGNSRGIEFLHADARDIDFTNADIAYTCDIMFDAEMRESMACTARRMRPGAMFVSHRGLPGPGFIKVKTIVLATDYEAHDVHCIQAVVRDSGAK